MSQPIGGQHLIAGEWVGAGTETFHAVNPATGAALEPAFHEASQREVDAALQAAREAYIQSLDLPPRWPADLLDSIAQHIMDLGDVLLERAEAETALPRPRLVGERARTCNQLQMFSKIVHQGLWVDAVIDTGDPNRKPAPKPDLRRMLRPRGSIVVFGASNFPFAFSTAGGDTASALAAGCPVIVKGHPSHPGTSELFAGAILHALKHLNLPLGLFAMLQGRKPDLGAMLVKHPHTTAVAFTGSLQAGRALFNLAAAREQPIPVFAEMGSLNPVVILPGAISERGDKIAQDLAASILMGHGQFCTKPGIIFTVGENDQNFVRALARQISSSATGTMLNQNLRESFRDRIEQFAGVPGVHAIVFGQSQGHAGISPALFETDAQVWKRESRLRQEAFGPGAVVIHCRDVDQAIDCIDSLDGSLTGTIHVGGEEDAAGVMRAMEAKVGRVIINGYPTGVEVCSAIVHGGPYPATTDAASTSVGSAAIRRFVRMVAYQDAPDTMLPPALQSGNPLRIQRTVDGVLIS